LQKRPRFVGVYVNLLAALDSSANHSQSRSIAAGGQRPRVAMRKDSALVRHQLRAICSHGFAGGDIFVVHGERVGQQRLLYFGEARSLRM
jgi:hypothetical protein